MTGGECKRARVKQREKWLTRSRSQHTQLRTQPGALYHRNNAQTAVYTVPDSRASTTPSVSARPVDPGSLFSAGVYRLH